MHDALGDFGTRFGARFGARLTQSVAAQLVQHASQREDAAHAHHVQTQQSLAALAAASHVDSTRLSDTLRIAATHDRQHLATMLAEQTAHLSRELGQVVARLEQKFENNVVTAHMQNQNAKRLLTEYRQRLLDCDDRSSEENDRVRARELAREARQTQAREALRRHYATDARDRSEVEVDKHAGNRSKGELDERALIFAAQSNELHAQMRRSAQHDRQGRRTLQQQHGQHVAAQQSALHTRLGDMEHQRDKHHTQAEETQQQRDGALDVAEEMQARSHGSLRHARDDAHVRQSLLQQHTDYLSQHVATLDAARTNAGKEQEQSTARAHDAERERDGALSLSAQIQATAASALSSSQHTADTRQRLLETHNTHLLDHMAALVYQKGQLEIEAHDSQQQRDLALDLSEHMQMSIESALHATHSAAATRQSLLQRHNTGLQHSHMLADHRAESGQRSLTATLKLGSSSAAAFAQLQEKNRALTNKHAESRASMQLARDAEQRALDAVETERDTATLQQAHHLRTQSTDKALRDMHIMQLQSQAPMADSDLHARTRQLSRLLKDETAIVERVRETAKQREDVAARQRLGIESLTSYVAKFVEPGVAVPQGSWKRVLHGLTNVVADLGWNEEGDRDSGEEDGDGREEE